MANYIRNTHFTNKIILKLQQHRGKKLSTIIKLFSNEEYSTNQNTGKCILGWDHNFYKPIQINDFA